uniref:AlNc14C68G4748 protein n=1 Tax=Albugo laibachii Nc14 TaxID=890382 RepID=F0WDM7_9STRA|nr:AlNc14C68G4748 [Albugo laibachii Nc14]|eukprot:CCA19303.1 AlNc14C68G4748 [Albugo laibachii Nc14]
MDPLVRWIERLAKLKMPSETWETIHAKSEIIRRVLVQDAEHASNSKLLNMVFSDGYIQKLQERHNLKPRRIHGEAASSCAVDIEKGRAVQQNITREHRHCDILNMDESAYF